MTRDFSRSADELRIQGAHATSVNPETIFEGGTIVNSKSNYGQVDFSYGPHSDSVAA
jgi:hypothetical protein